MRRSGPIVPPRTWPTGSGGRMERSAFGHPGTGAGISGALTHYPDDDLILAVLVNTNGRDIPHARAIEAELAAAILELRSPAEGARCRRPARTVGGMARHVRRKLRRR